MKKLFFLSIFVVTFCSCKTVDPSLYYWAGYEGSYYAYYKNHTPESCGRLYESYLAMIAFPETSKSSEHPNSRFALGTRHTIPPGICAEYGYMLLAPETPSILKEYYSNPKRFPKYRRKVIAETDWDQVLAPGVMREKGLEMFQKEIELYPESAVFLEPLIKKLSQQ